MYIKAQSKGYYLTLNTQMFSPHPGHILEESQHVYKQDLTMLLRIEFGPQIGKLHIVWKGYNFSTWRTQQVLYELPFGTLYLPFVMYST